MADLTSIQATEAVRVVGSDATGSETNPVNSTSGGAIYTNLRNNAGTEIGTVSNPVLTSQLLDGSGVQGALSVGTSAVAARVGGSNLTNRKSLSVWNNGVVTIYWGFTNAVTTSSGTPLMRNQQLIIDAGPNTTIYLITTISSQDVRITEAA